MAKNRGNKKKQDLDDELLGSKDTSDVTDITSKSKAKNKKKGKGKENDWSDDEVVTNVKGSKPALSDDEEISAPTKKAAKKGIYILYK